MDLTLQPVASVQFQIFVIPVLKCSIVLLVSLPPPILFADKNIRDKLGKDRSSVFVA